MDTKRRILIVDDNASIHNDFKKILLSSEPDEELYRMENLLFNKRHVKENNLYQYIIDDAYQGVEAIEMVRAADKEKFPYSLVFMDVRMPPGIDGVITIEKIWSEFPDIEMVVCSAYSDYSWDRILEKFGITDKLIFIRKPFNIIVIKQLTLSLVSKWDIARKNRQYTQHLENEVKERTKELEELLQHMTWLKDKAEQSDRLKSAFLANMSHEFRSPMNAIMGFTDLLSKKSLTEEKKTKYLSCIRSSGRSLMNLINDIICIAKIEAGIIDINLETFSLNHLLKELKENFKVEIDNSFKYDVKLEFIFSRDDNFMIESDSERLKQIITNLFTNAFKFTESGYIKIGYLVDDKEIRFFVEDTGIGIPESDFEMIFMRFKQSPGGQETNTGGTGLGLTISKSLSELLGGRIWVESEQGKGSTFFFTIPYLKPGVNHSPDVMWDNEKQYVFDDKTILVAEDEEVNYLLVREMLESKNIKVLWGRNGMEAVDIFKSNNDIEIVLMDVKMPFMNGVEASRKIKEINCRIPVIAVTAYAMEEEKKFGDLGFDDYLNKPLISSEVYHKLSIWFTNSL